MYDLVNFSCPVDITKSYIYCSFFMKFCQLDRIFRYFDVTKNAGNWNFPLPYTETFKTLSKFIEEAETCSNNLEHPLQFEGSRVYVQETLSGHGELGPEFSLWDW